MDKKLANQILAVVIVAVCIAMLFVPVIPQAQTYHQFADNRAFFGIPNALNVLSNLPFLFIGVMGLAFCWQHHSSNTFSLTTYSIFFAGVFLTGFGSGYYHLAPNNETLVWDRLPMTIAFMALFTSVLSEWVNERFRYALIPLLALGVFSVWYWASVDDLRLYALVQFLPMLLLILILWWYESPYNQKKILCIALGWYVLAKLLEMFDQQVFSLLSISGHSLKHVAAAISPLVILRMLQTRQPKM